MAYAKEKTIRVPPKGKKSSQPGMAAPQPVAKRRKALSKQLKDLKAKPAPDVLTKKLPYIRKKPNIRRVIVDLHKIFQSYPQKTSPLCEEHEGTCTFCKYHAEIMDDNFIDECSSNKVCQETNVVYLMYCIHCDEMFLDFKEQRFELLLDIRFGFLDDKECEPEKGHNKRYLRCIIIDKKDGQLTERFLNLKKGETQLSMWEDILKVKRFTNKKEKMYPNPKDELYLSQQYHCIIQSEVKIYCRLKIPLLNCKFENIVYLHVCNNCRIKYVRRITNTCLITHSSGFLKHYQESPFHLHTVEEGSECTFRDFRWSVIDALNEEQNQFLEKWTMVFNQCDTELKKKMCAVIRGGDGALRDELIEKCMSNKSINLDANMPGKNNEIPSDEASLKTENLKWIENTKQAFIEDREKYWMTKLQTFENGLNKIKASSSDNISENLYNEAFQNLGNK